MEQYVKDVLTLSDDQPVVVQFSTKWCAPCKIMKPIMTQIQSERGDFLYKIVDAEDNPKASMAYKIRSVPTIYLIEKGEIVSNYRGLANPVQINGWLDKVIKK